MPPDTSFSLTIRSNDPRQLTDVATDSTLAPACRTHRLSLTKLDNRFIFGSPPR